MATKIIDYDVLLDMYSTIGKKRPLSEQELDRVTDLIQKQKDQRRHTRYRENNKEIIKEKDKAYKQLPKVKQRANQTARKRRAEDGRSGREASRRWTAANPDKVQEKHKRRNEGRQEVARLEKEAGAKRNVDKIAFWEKMSTQRPLTSHEQNRVSHLRVITDPNSFQSQQIRERNRRNREKKKASFGSSDVSTGKGDET